MIDVLTVQFGEYAVTITTMHMAYIGAVVLGIGGLLGAWKGKKWWTGKNQARFANAMKTISDDLTGKVEGHIINMGHGFEQSLENAIGRAIDKIDATQALTTPSLPAAGKANDPGFFKSVSLPTKIGDLFELEKVMGRFKLWAAVKEQTTIAIDVINARLAPPGTFDRIKRSLGWQTYGAKGDQPLTPVRLIECDTNHLENIIATQSHLSPLYYHVILSILRDRYTWTKS